MTYWYVATPYSNFPEGREAAFQMACKQVALLLQHGIPAYSPIVHSHPLVGFLPSFGHEDWLHADLPMMQAACGLIVVRAGGWFESRGVWVELENFRMWRKPIVFMELDTLPEGVPT